MYHTEIPINPFHMSRAGRTKAFERVDSTSLDLSLHMKWCPFKFVIRYRPTLDLKFNEKSTGPRVDLRNFISKKRVNSVSVAGAAYRALTQGDQIANTLVNAATGSQSGSALPIGG